MKVLACEQRTVEWFAARAGLLTGSCVADVVAVRKRGTGELKNRIDLRRRLVVERLTGRPVGELDFVPAYMRRGTDLEPAAFARYEAETGELVARVGFVQHDALLTGCSPDGYVGAWDGVIELKCPKAETHLEYLQAKVLPEEYRPQCVHALWLTGAPWVELCSFDDRFPEDLQLFRAPRLYRHEVDLAAHELAVRLFLSEVDAVYAEALTLRN